uniref:Flap endonuclease 1 n=1 Tax=Dermatophagoides pteronyssinus TaxID=6956 RepID=A0A6P6YH51_DERPT|nr:flap endonuclease 1-like [Dermatophagoides pteronyssinus]
MGILGLSRLIADVAPEAIKEIELKSLFGRRIAIDASMCIYQFLIAIRSSEYMMTNEQGETTSHLVGLFYRTIKLLETGIKPVYVFDGKAPKLKCGELEKRAERRTEAKDKLEEAKELQNVEDIEKLNKRLVKVTRKHSDDCKRLLQLLGIPIVQAPSEAEAQCAQLCKENLVYAAATEDMDALTFGCPRLIRNLTSGQNEKVKEYQIGKVLTGLDISQDQFIDLSILMGCDYCSNIRGIGGKKGLDLIRKFDSIEGILKNKFGIEEYVDVEIEYSNRKIEPKKEEEEENNDEVKKNGNVEEQQSVPKMEISDEIKQENDIAEDDEFASKFNNNDSDQDENEDKNNDDNGDEDLMEQNDSPKKGKTNKKQMVPENWPFRGARKLFQQPLVIVNEITENDLKMKDIDEEGMIQFLCIENGFNEDRVRKSLKRARESKQKGAQTRIDTFFKMMPSSSNSPNKRPIDSKNSNGKKNSNNKRGRRGR